MVGVVVGEGWGGFMRFVDEKAISEWGSLVWPSRIKVWNRTRGTRAGRNLLVIKQD